MNVNKVNKLDKMDYLLTYLRILSNWLTTLIYSCIIFIPISYTIFLILRTWIRAKAPRIPRADWKQSVERGETIQIVGFFHPYCNAGGGGERVLWVAIQSLQNRYKHLRFVIYTGDQVDKDEILHKAHQRFNIILPRPDDIHFLYLKRRAWVEATPYPFFTLLGQSVGSIILGLEALLACNPDVYIDSMGYAFTLPVFRFLGGCRRLGCYVHYPTISTDMLERVASRRLAYNNASFISRSRILSHLKLVYYRLFAYAYGVAGNRSNIVMVNSSWTLGHIENLWTGTAGRVTVVYPPCDVRGFLSIPLKEERASQEVQSIVSVAQFRPEKDHSLQITAFARFIKKQPATSPNSYRLVLVGSCRNSEDETRVEALRHLAETLKVKDLVEFHLNVSFEELKKSLAEATIGLHTMWNEHFGIGVVECMAAGTLILAHDSGGPKLDIVIDFEGRRTGFLASDEESYAAAMETIFRLGEKERNVIRENARQSVARFSDEEFERSFVETTRELFC